MKRILTILAVAAAIGSMALAQGGGQRGGQRGGFQRGGPGLLNRADVQKELKMTSSQKSKIESLLESQRGQRFGGGGGGRGGNDGGGRRGGGGGRRGGFGGGLSPEMVKSIKGILDDAQYKRFTELSLQQAGGFALNREDIAKQLKLTSKQKSELQEINQDMRADMQDMFSGGGGGGGDFAAIREEIQALREDYGKDMLKLLTADQKKIWASMVGKTFKFQQIDR